MGRVDPLARRFVAASLAWLLLGTALGLALALPLARQHLPPGGNPLAAHAHLQLYGFVTMMIFGIALHVLPRFEGRPLPHPRLAAWQFLAANAGLALFTAGQLLGLEAAVAAGGVLMAAGVALFVAQVAALWRRART